MPLWGNNQRWGDVAVAILKLKFTHRHNGVFYFSYTVLPQFADNYNVLFYLLKYSTMHDLSIYSAMWNTTAYLHNIVMCFVFCERCKPNSLLDLVLQHQFRIKDKYTIYMLEQHSHFGFTKIYEIAVVCQHQHTTWSLYVRDKHRGYFNLAW